MRRAGSLLLLLTASAAVVGAWLFPRAFPLVALEHRISREEALQRADSFLTVHALAPPGARRAVRFVADDSLRTYVELEAGGPDSVVALLRDRDVALYSWVVRAFAPGEDREARVRLAPDGRVIGFRRVLPDSLVRPAVGEDVGRDKAQQVIVSWLGDSLARWRPVSSSYVTRTPGGRIDRTYTWEQSGRTIGAAPLRLDVVIAGDLETEARPYAVVPESFGRRYGEMRSANDFLALLATIGLLGLAVAGAVALRRYARRGEVRWRPAMAVGVVVGVLVGAALLNELPGSWFEYDTATSAPLHLAVGVVAALAGGAGTTLMVALTLAAAEALTRHAFPWHLDWWKLWRYRGTREVAGRVLGGYALAAVGFAYIAAFYLVTRSVLHWWVPTEMLDDPNQIATPAPWLAGIALSLQAGLWEEALFRAIPLSLIALWAAPRADRERWLALGVVGTALAFGFAHSNYPSWPPYSRGIEIFLEASLWAVIFLRFGLLVSVVAHFTFDLTLFGMFATSGRGAAYLVTGAVTLLALASPALAVAWTRWRRRGWTALPGDATFSAWSPSPATPMASPWLWPTAPVLGARLRLLAMVLPVVALVAAILVPARPVAGPAYLVGRARAVAVADSMLEARGVDPATWHRLPASSADTLATWRRFLAREGAEPLAEALEGSYAIPAWWIVRYVRTDVAVEVRAEEWRVRVFPDGRPLDARHLLPEGRPGASLEPDSARLVARAALSSAGLDPDNLIESKYEDVERPARRDITLTYTDRTVHLPDGAAARAWVSIAGDQVLVVRRGVELPEAFRRDQRRDGQLGLAVSGLFAMVALSLVIWGVVRVMRRPPRVSDAPGRGVRPAIAGALVLSVSGESLQSLPGTLAAYDTAVPWKTFLGTIAAEQVFTLLIILVIGALWMLLNGLRRRASIPLVASPSEGARPVDDLVRGLAMGAVASLVGVASRFLLAGRLPSGPATVLDRLIPALGGAPGVVASAAMIVPAVAIPALALSGIARGRRMVLVLAFLLIGLVGGAMLAGDAAGGTGIGFGTVTFGIAAAITVVLTLRAFGGASVTSWIVAALGATGLAACRDILQSSTPTDRVAAAVTAVVCATLVALVWRWALRFRTGVHAVR